MKMKKLILTESEKNRIKELYGIQLLQPSLPYIVTGGHTAKNGDCDAFHGFQLSRNNANMNGMVKDALDKFAGQGVWVSNVEITMANVKTLRVEWKVTIDKSADGEFWNGFTSRGAGCNEDILNRWNSETVGNGINSIEKKIISSKTCKVVKDIELINQEISFTELGEYSFVQGFYRYKCSDINPTTNVVNKKTDETNKFPTHYRGSVDLGKDAFNELSRKLQKWSNDESQDGDSFMVGSFNLQYNNNDNKISFDIFGKPTDPKYTKLILAINDEAKAAQEAKGYKLISSGKIQLPGEFASSRLGGYSWYIFGEPLK